jgi:hypothetical protein
MGRGHRQDWHENRVASLAPCLRDQAVEEAARLMQKGVRR